MYKLYYLDFTADTFAAVSANYLKTRSNYALRFTAQDYRRLVRRLDDRLMEEHHNPLFTRLYIPAINGCGEYIVDQQGVVQHEGKSYMIRPYSFLLLGRYMDYLKRQNGKKE